MRVERSVLKSTVLEEDVDIHIYVPDEPEKVSELMVVLDGEALFNYVSATVEYYTSSIRAPPLVVAGLEVRDRVKCFSPSPTLDHIGVEKFTESLRGEILPEIERIVGATHLRTLVGHSLGGIYSLYNMFECVGMFEAWVALSPPISIFYDYLRGVASRNGECVKGSLFLAQDGSNVENLDRANELVGRLRESIRSLRVEQRLYENADHFTIVAKSFPDALEFLVPILAHRHE